MVALRFGFGVGLFMFLQSFVRECLLLEACWPWWNYSCTEDVSRCIKTEAPVDGKTLEGGFQSWDSLRLKVFWMFTKVPIWYCRNKGALTHIWWIINHDFPYWGIRLVNSGTQSCEAEAVLSQGRSPSVGAACHPWRAITCRPWGRGMPWEVRG